MIEIFTRIPGSLARAAAAAIMLLALTACAGDDGAQELFGDGSLACAGNPAQTEWRTGCATARNIAALAEEPADLHRPRPEGQRDSVQRDSSLSAYMRNRTASSQNAPAAAAAQKGGQP